MLATGATWHDKAYKAAQLLGNGHSQLALDPVLHPLTVDSPHSVWCSLRAQLSTLTVSGPLTAALSTNSTSAVPHRVLTHGQLVAHASHIVTFIRVSCPALSLVPSLLLSGVLPFERRILLLRCGFPIPQWGIPPGVTESARGGSCRSSAVLGAWHIIHKS